MRVRLPMNSSMRKYINRIRSIESMLDYSEQSSEKVEKSLQDFSHSHPYEYLTKLNCIYNGYNRSTTKDFSSASKIKLPFKKFNTIKVPDCFEQNYAKEKKELIQFSSVQDGKTDDNQKKLWKEHRQIIKKYLEEKQSKKSRVSKPKNKEFAEKILKKDKSNIFLKKIIEKGTKFEYDEKKFEEEVLEKLKNLNRAKSKAQIRCQTAKVTSEVRAGKSEEKAGEKEKVKVSERDYLEFDREEDMIVKYKGLIKQVDCSISQKNIQKTSLLLKQMEKIVSSNTYS